MIGVCHNIVLNDVQRTRKPKAITEIPSIDARQSEAIKAPPATVDANHKVLVKQISKFATVLCSNRSAVDVVVIV